MKATSKRKQAYRAVVILVALGISVGAIVALTPTTGAAEVSVESLDVSDHEQTVTGDVTDVGLSATLNYEHDVADADRTLLKLKAGESEDDLTMIDYQQVRDPQPQASGTVDLSGSLLEAGYTAGDFEPPLAHTSSQEVVVQAVIEVQRAGGDPVVHTATDTATIRLTDDAELTATIGGEGTFEVSTSG